MFLYVDILYITGKKCLLHPLILCEDEMICLNHVHIAPCFRANDVSDDL